MSRSITRCMTWAHSTLILAAVLSIFTNFFPASAQWSVTVCYGIAIPVICASLAASYLEHLWQYLLVCVVLHVGIWYGIPNEYYRFLFLAGSAVVCFLFFVARVKEEASWMEQPHYLCLILFFALYILSFYLERTAIRTFIYQTAFLYFICYAVYVNQKNFMRYLELNRDTANFPYQQLKTVNTVMLSLFVGILIVGMVIVPQSGLDAVLMQLGMGLLAAIRWLVALFAKEQTAQPAILPEEVEEETSAVLGIGESYTRPMWMEFIEHLLSWTITITIVVAAIVGILYGLYRVYQAFDRTNLSDNGDKREFLSEKTQAKWLFGEEGAKRTLQRPRWFDFSPKAALRRLWLKGVREHKKEKITPNLTPSEVHHAVEWENETARTLYEQARYGNQEVTSEQVEQMKAAMRKKE